MILSWSDFAFFKVETPMSCLDSRDGETVSLLGALSTLENKLPLALHHCLFSELGSSCPLIIIHHYRTRINSSILL